MRRLRIDMEELRWAFEDRDSDLGWYLDTETGTVLSVGGDLEEPPVSLEEIENDETGRFLFIEPEDSREGYRDMEQFTATVKDSKMRESLQVALAGKGAFRRFKEVVAQVPQERERWFRFHDERVDARARAWLAENGIEAEA